MRASRNLTSTRILHRAQTFFLPEYRCELAFAMRFCFFPVPRVHVVDRCSCHHSVLDFNIAGCYPCRRDGLRLQALDNAKQVYLGVSALIYQFKTLTLTLNKNFRETLSPLPPPKQRWLQLWGQIQKERGRREHTHTCADAIYALKHCQIDSLTSIKQARKLKILSAARS